MQTARRTGRNWRSRWRLSFFVRGGLGFRGLLRHNEGIFLLVYAVVFRLLLRRLFLHGFRGSIAHGGNLFVGFTHRRNVRFPVGVSLDWGNIPPTRGISRQDRIRA